MHEDWVFFLNKSKTKRRYPRQCFRGDNVHCQVHAVNRTRGQKGTGTFTECDCFQKVI